MFEVRAHFDTRHVRGLKEELSPRKWAFATSLALTAIARDVAAAERSEMRRAFDRPTPFTLNSLWVSRATPQRMSAAVATKDASAGGGRSADRWLWWGVAGGRRNAVAFEMGFRRAGLLAPGRALVPVAVPRDRYGNVARSTYTRVLQALKVTGKANRVFYGRGGKKRQIGIWERRHDRLVALFLEVPVPVYRTRFHFADVAERTVERVAQDRFEQALAKELGR